MALNKAKTSLGIKVALILLIVAFVVSFIPALGGLFSSPGGTATPATNDPVQAANAQYQPTVAALTSQLQSDPESYTALVALGNTYFDWALSVQQASQTSTASIGAEQPLWVASKDAYERAVKVKNDESGVVVDFAITQFYTGDTTGAIKTAEGIRKKDATFAPAWFNLAVFYGAQGDNAKSLKYFKKAIELDPKGESVSVDYAKQQVAALESQTGTGTP